MDEEKDPRVSVRLVCAQCYSAAPRGTTHIRSTAEANGTKRAAAASLLAATMRSRASSCATGVGRLPSQVGPTFPTMENSDGGRCSEGATRTSACEDVRACSAARSPPYQTRDMHSLAKLRKGRLVDVL